MSKGGNEMKLFEEPIIEVKNLEVVDVITTSQDWGGGEV